MAAKEIKKGAPIPFGVQLVIEAGGCLHIAEYDPEAQKFYVRGGKRYHYINGVTRVWDLT